MKKILLLLIIASVVVLQVQADILSGYVYTSWGSVASNVKVSIKGLETYSVVTDTAGYYSVDVKSGICTVSISDTRYVSTSKSVSVNGNTSCSLVLESQEILSGDVEMGQCGSYSYAGIYDYDNLRISPNTVLYSYGVSEIVINVKGTLTIGNGAMIRVRNGYSEFNNAPSIYPSSMTNKTALSYNVSNSGQYTIIPRVYGKGGNGGHGGNGANGTSIYFPVQGGGSVSLKGDGGNGGGGGAGGFGGGNGNSGGLYGVCAFGGRNNGSLGGDGTNNGGDGGRGLVVSGGKGGFDLAVGAAGPTSSSYGGGAGGGGNGGNGGNGAEVDNASSSHGQAGHGGNGGGGGAGGYGGGILVITASKIVFEGNGYFLVNGQKGGIGGKAGYAYYNSAANGDNGLNGGGGVLIVNCPQFDKSGMITNATISESLPGHGTVTGGAGATLFNVSVPAESAKTLMGRVFATDKSSVSGLSVKVGDYVATTNKNGIFLISSIASGTYKMTVADNYNVLSASLITISSQDSTVEVPVKGVIYTPSYTLDEKYKYDGSLHGKYNITVKRKFAAGWNTICLPFGITQTDLGTDSVATFTKYADNTIYFAKMCGTDSLKANIPYLIYFEKDSTFNKEFRNVMMESGLPKAISKGNKAIYYGNYSADFDLKNCYYLYDRKFVKAIDDSSKLKSLSAYFDITNNENIDSLKVSFYEATTGIESINSATDPGKIPVYDLNGRFVGYGISGLTSGLYIFKNGKILIK
jgi:hypothetical protein